ncbi:uncharacterized protein PAC_01495 [Phialocephala subalpina]|uniref:GmrSD restriction endonucleases N-terminal domain-containing protein n=1 Tax=Phialocephala subalpina TaxID=576137 RepID=A0A1L7WFT4_9HELO|nr:uncharacterized protein PAC_01495 [Phialocephala subalpina]
MEATSSAAAAPMPAEPKKEEPTTEQPKTEEPEPKAEEPEMKSEEPKQEPEPYIKEDPDAPEFVSAHSTGRRPRVKPEPEEPAQVTIDLSLPEADDDMFEDVDGDEYVDLTYEGIAHVNGVRHFVCEGFKIRQIPEPFIVKRSLFDLYQCIDAKSIILDPEYQRDVVWDEGRAALLVTSILMGYFIPPIIFNVKKTTVKVEGRDEVRYTRICVDGKQRLTSIWKFLKGQIGFFDNNSPQRKWFYCHQVIDGRIQVNNRNILPNAVKEFFKKQFFCCYEYEELDQDTEETMFQLVQRGIALTPAEKMRALSTEWALFTKQFEDDYALVVNLSKQNRASGFRLVLTIFTMIIEVEGGIERKKKGTNNNPNIPTLQASPQALAKVLEDKKPIDPEIKAKMKSVFDRYETLVKMSSTKITTTRYKVKPNSVFDPAPEYLRNANVNWVRTFSPLELIVTAVLVHVHQDHRSDEELLEDVRAMRQFLRTYHKDLRVNSQCWAISWTFITTEMDKRRGIVREPRAPSDPENSIGFGTNATRPAVAVAPLRLKRSGAVISSSSSNDFIDDRDSSDLTSVSSSDESSEDDGPVFEGLMSPRGKRPPPKKDTSKAKGTAKTPSKAKPKGVTKVSFASKGKAKAGAKRTPASRPTSASSSSAKKARKS